ncbi:hypothetical protein L484_021676 [Morus notabilis]|uniref:Uncharacterized protein n=1 Tax=Morus notabilis TaxID=981085 RepID=W9SVA4_9ROSA|nr:hypothetical protein L484_021676 [Morus notabilis]
MVVTITPPFGVQGPCWPHFWLSTGSDTICNDSHLYLARACAVLLLDFNPKSIIPLADGVLPYKLSYINPQAMWDYTTYLFWSFCLK